MLKQRHHTRQVKSVTERPNRNRALGFCKMIGWSEHSNNSSHPTNRNAETLGMGISIMLTRLGLGKKIVKHDLFCIISITCRTKPSNTT